MEEVEGLKKSKKDEWCPTRLFFVLCQQKSYDDRPREIVRDGDVKFFHFFRRLPRLPRQLFSACPESVLVLSRCGLFSQSALRIEAQCRTRPSRDTTTVSTTLPRLTTSEKFAAP